MANGLKANGLNANGLKAKSLRATSRSEASVRLKAPVRLEAPVRLKATDRPDTINNLKTKTISSKDRLTSPTLRPATNETHRCKQHVADGESSVRTMLGVIGNPLTHLLNDVAN